MALLCLPFSTPAEAQDGQSHQAGHFSAWPRFPWRTVLTYFGSEMGGIVLSQEEVPTGRLLPLVTISASFQPGSADAQAALGSAGLSSGHGWAGCALTWL